MTTALVQIPSNSSITNIYSDNFTRKIFNSICANLTVVLIGWLTPSITSTILSKLNLNKATYNAIYIPIASVAVTFGTTFFMPVLYVFRFEKFLHTLNLTIHKKFLIIVSYFNNFSFQFILFSSQYREESNKLIRNVIHMLQQKCSSYWIGGRRNNAAPVNAWWIANSTLWNYSQNITKIFKNDYVETRST